MEKEKDNDTLLLALGIGAFAYLLTRKSEQQNNDTTTNDNSGSASNNQTAPATPQIIVVPQQTQQTQQTQLTEEDLQKYLQKFQSDMADSLRNQLREYTLEEQAQEEQEAEKELLADIYSEEQVTSLDLRDKAKDILGKFCINYFRQIGNPGKINEFKNLPKSFYDIYNFADADTLLSANTLTQRNNIDVCRFRINELSVFNFQRRKIDGLNVFKTDYYIDAINPSDSSVQFSAYPYKMLVDDFVFVPYFSYDYIEKFLRNLSRDQYFVYEIWEKYAKYPFDNKNVESYLLDVVGKILSYYPVADYKQFLSNVSDVYMQSDEYYKKYRYIDIEPKSIYVAPQENYWVCKDGNDFISSFNNYSSAKRKITIFYYLFDETNRIARNIELTGYVIQRPVLGERDTAYITDIRTKDF